MLVTAQVALSTVLLVGAGLFARTLVNLSRAPLGFRADHVLLFELDPPRLFTAPLSADAREGWQLAQWRSAPEHIVALALRTSAPLEVLAWQTSGGNLLRPTSAGVP